MPGAILSCGDEDDTLFMSGALVHLACCTPGEQLEALRILREGGCTRRPDLRNDVTHVVVRACIRRLLHPASISQSLCW